MATKKKTTIVTAESLKAKSESAISAFKTLIAGLKATNEEAAVARAANAEQIAKLEQENATIDLLTAQNDKIVHNVENLFIV